MRVLLLNLFVFSSFAFGQNEDSVGEISSINFKNDTALVRIRKAAHVNVGDIFAITPKCLLVVVGIREAKETRVEVATNRCKDKFEIKEHSLVSMYDNERWYTDSGNRAVQEIETDVENRLSFPCKEISASFNLAMFQIQGSNTTIAMGGRYDYLFADGVQFGFSATYSKSSFGAYEVSGGSVMVGPTINIGDKPGLSGAFAIGVRVGVTTADIKGVGSSSEFTWSLDASPRIKVIEGLHYRPTLGYTKVAKADGAFVIIPLNFSYVF